MTTQFSKIGFVFLIFSIVAGGYVQDIFPCQLHKVLSDNIYAKHVIGLILLTCLIMMEGGWDFNKKENDKFPNDWSSGNILHTMVYAIGLYIIFVLMSKNDLKSSVTIFSLLGLLYIVNTQKNYWLIRKTITQKQADITDKFLWVIIAVVLLVFVRGFSRYITYQKKEYGGDFSWNNFFIGKVKCDGM